MNFDFTPEQEQLRDSVRRVLAGYYAFEKRQALVTTGQLHDPDAWQQLAELGLLGLMVPEEDGGFGGTTVDALVVLEEMGRVLALEPFIGSAMLAPRLLATSDDTDVRQRYLAALVEGREITLPALFEPGSRYATTVRETSARRDGDGWRLTGRKAMVTDGPCADRFLVAARLQDSGTTALFGIAADTPGLVRQNFRSHDGQGLSELTFENLALPAGDMLASDSDLADRLEDCRDLAAAAVCFEAVGAMQASFDLTLEYLKTRKQFGVPIGSFQSLQHRAVEMLQQLEQARSASYLAAARLAHDDRAAARASVATAKFVVGEAARFVGQQAVQLHGGIGMTEEYAVGHYFKRLTMIAASFGDGDFQLDRLVTTLVPPAA